MRFRDETWNHETAVTIKHFLQEINEDSTEEEIAETKEALKTSLVWEGLVNHAESEYAETLADILVRTRILDFS